MPDKQSIKQACLRMHALAVFRALLKDRVIRRFMALLDGLDGPVPARVDLYCDFVAALYAEGGDLGALLLRRVLESENPAVRAIGRGETLSKFEQRSLDEELATFTLVASLAPPDIQSQVGGNAPLPGFANSGCDFSALYTRRLAEIGIRGFGFFASYHMFTLSEEGAIQPVKNPDPQRLADLTGYEKEREQVVINTRALLKGLPAGNILLYGDAGTGKSSTVKAIANEYRMRGLRLVEIRKNQIYLIPRLMDDLADNPLKFIFFIDDLSFPSDDADFTALKAILEGNVSARPDNIVVYATSNRRHMVRERHADRQDELNVADTLEEEASLAARFGLTVTFLKPDRVLFGEIVTRLAEEYNLRSPVEELLAKAEIHALRHGGRSPRTARQFVEFIKAAEEDNQDIDSL